MVYRRQLAALLMVLATGGMGRAGAQAPGQEPAQDPGEAAAELLAATRDLYRRAQHFQATGKALTMILSPETGEETHIGGEFTIRLARPRYYRIEWRQQLGMGRTTSGAVWNDGDGPRIYLGASGSYSELESDALAFAAATGVSMAASHTIPTLFFPLESTRSMLDRLREPVLEGSQVVGGQDCHIVAGHMDNNVRYRLWIATNEPYIVQVENALGGTLNEPAIPDPTPEQIEATLAQLKLEPTDENRERIRTSLVEARRLMSTVRGTSKQLYLDVNLVRPIETDAFHFEVPEGTVHKNPFERAAPAEAADDDDE